MRAQHDMFDPLDPDPPLAEPHDDDAETTPQLPPIAAPCGYRDRSNQPCARLASKPLCIDGVQLVSRGIPMLLCDTACFRGSSTAHTSDEAGAGDAIGRDDDPESGRDPDDPGYDGAWEDGAWERDDGQDGQ